MDDEHVKKAKLLLIKASEKLLVARLHYEEAKTSLIDAQETEKIMKTFSSFSSFLPFLTD